MVSRRSPPTVAARSDGGGSSGGDRVGGAGLRLRFCSNQTAGETKLGGG